MKKEEHDKHYLTATRCIMQYPKGLEQYMPVDETARSMILLYNNDITETIRRYFDEQTKIKQQVSELYEELEKLFGDYQKNAGKLLEYIKGLNL